jgi:hypothetical protein
VAERATDSIAVDTMTVDVESSVEAVTKKLRIRSRYGRGREDKRRVDETNKENESQPRSISR